MKNVNLSIIVQFSEDDFDMAYLMLKQQFGNEMPPKDFFITAPNTVVNYSSLDKEQAAMICASMIGAKIAFSAAEAAVETLKEPKSKIITDLNS